MGRARKNRNRRRREEAARANGTVAGNGRDGLDNGPAVEPEPVVQQPREGNGAVPITENLTTADRALIRRAIKEKWNIPAKTMRAAVRAYSVHVESGSVIDDGFSDAVDKLLSMYRCNLMAEEGERKDLESAMKVFEFNKQYGLDEPATGPLMMPPEAAASELSELAWSVNEQIADEGEEETVG